MTKVVGEEERDLRVRIFGDRLPPISDGFVDGEEVVGPRVVDEERRRRDRVVDVIGGVEARDLVRDLHELGVPVVRLARADSRVPGRQVGGRIGARRRVVAAPETGVVEERIPRLLLDTAARAVGVVHAIVESAAVRRARRRGPTRV
jgi:hypothetical protein